MRGPDLFARLRLLPHNWSGDAPNPPFRPIAAAYEERWDKVIPHDTLVFKCAVVVGDRVQSEGGTYSSFTQNSRTPVCPQIVVWDKFHHVHTGQARPSRA